MTIAHKWFYLITGLITAFLIFLLSPVLTPFLMAALLAYLGDPIVNMLGRWKIPRTLAVVVVFVLFFLLVLILLLLFIPLVEKQISVLIHRIPQIFNWLQNTAIPWLMEHVGHQDSFNLATLQSIVAKHLQQAGGIATNILGTLTKSGFAFIGVLVNLVLIPVVTFYLLRDWHTVLGNVDHLLPRHIQPTVIKLANESNEVVGAFLRGQLMVMFALGIIYSTGLWFTGLDLALLIGMIAGLISIVPYLGFIVGIAAATIAAFFQFHDIAHIIYVWIAFGVGQMAESMLLTPLLVGDRIGLHPVAVIFAIMVGGQLFGFVGILLALPLAAVLMVILRHMMQRYVASGVYQSTAVEPS